MMQKLYEQVDGNFYDDAVKSPNPISRAYHLHRYAKIRQYVEEAGLQGGRILDIGCGSCAWNCKHWEVTGFDLSEKLLVKGILEKRLAKKVVGDIENGLPFKDGEFDAVVLTEVLEHLENPQEKLREMARVVRKGGCLIVTVPFGSWLGAWEPLFALQCFYMGSIKGQEYYRKKCGHINAFDEKSLGKMLSSCGFEPQKMHAWMRFNLACLARKK